MRPILYFSLPALGIAFSVACGSGGSDFGSSSGNGSSSGGSSSTSSSGGSSSGATSGGPDASAQSCAPLVEEAIAPSPIAWQGAPRCSADGVCTVYPTPTDGRPIRIRAAASGSTWAAGTDAVYSWNGSQGRVHSIDTTTHLTAVAPITDDDVWAVGEGEVVAHWNGSTWTVSKLPLGSALNAVFALASNDVWTVGNFGVVGHWNGSEWSAVALPGSPVLQDVWAVAANDVWAAEWNGGLWHYDGTWSKVASAGTGSFEAVWSPGAGDVWALGENALYRGGVANVAPVSVPGASSFGFDAIWGSSSADVWLADSTSMFHLANGAWTKLPYGARAFTGRQANDVWALGDTHVLHWDGATWNGAFQVGFPAINGAWRSPNGDIWFVGAKGTILRVRSGELRRMTTTLSEIRDLVLRAAWGSSDTDVWFGGTGSSLLHLVNGEVCTVAKPASSVSAMSGSGADDIWAVGDGKSMHWDGKAWTAATLVSAESVYAFSKTDAWATGGAQVQRWNGTTWSPVTTPVTIDSFFTRFGIIGATAANDMWIPVDQFGTNEVLHWDGSGWTKTTSPGTGYDAVYARGENDVWMLDWNIHHYDGNEWKRLSTFPRRTVSAAIATSAELWIATTDGGILRLPM